MGREDFNITELIERVRDGQSPRQVIEEIILREKLSDKREEKREKRTREKADP